MVQAIRVVRFFALSAAIAAIACAHAAAQSGTEHTMSQANAGRICDMSNKMKQVAARLALEAHTKVAAATALRARAGALGDSDGLGGRAAGQGDAARKAVEVAEAAAQKTTAIFHKALAAHAQLTHLAGQIDGWMLQLSTYNGGQSRRYNVQCISTGNRQSVVAGGNDKYEGTNAQRQVAAQLTTIRACLGLPEHAPEPSGALTKVTVAKLEDALKEETFVVPFDGDTTTGADLELKTNGSSADTGCNLLSGETRDNKAALFDTLNGANPFAVFGGLWIASAKTNSKGIKLTITKKDASKSSYSSGTAVIGTHGSGAEERLEGRPASTCSEMRGFIGQWRKTECRFCFSGL
ncbi:hypothetical protein ERJ75_001107100 [Trypanosoma vivax]|nr:hypothetical protein ERJ75_001107100 [Trypanosoma vivax]